MSYTVPGLIFIGGLLAALVADSHSTVLVRESILATSTLGGIFWFFHRKRFQRLEDHVFYVASVLMLMAAFVNGGTFLGETPIPRLKLFLKAIFLLCLAMLFVAFRKKASPGLLVLLTAVLSSNVFLQWFYLGITLRSIPLAAYLITAWFYLRQSNRAPRLDRVDWLLGVLCLTSLLSTIFAWDRVSSTFGFLHLVLGAPFFLIARHYLPYREIRWFFLACILLFAAAMLFFAFFAVYTIQTGGAELSERIAGYQINAVGGYISVFLSILLWALITQQNLAVRMGVAATIGMALFVLYITSSRASMLAVAATASAYFVVFPRQRPIRHGARVALVLLSAILSAAVIWWFREDVTSQPIFSGETLTIRLAVWKLYLANTWSHSPLLGFGPESYLMNASMTPGLDDPQLLEFLKHFIETFGPLLHAHNLIVQVIQNFGILGILPCAGLALFLLLQSLRTLRMPAAPASQIAAQIALGALFVQEMFDFTLGDAMTYYPAMAMLGLAMRSLGNPTQPESILQWPRLRAWAGAAFAAAALAALSIVAWNRILYVRQVTLFRGEYTADAFANLTFQPNTQFSLERIHDFEENDKKVFLNQIDHRIHQVAGEFYLELYKRGIRKDSLPIAERRFRDCLEILPRSAFCAGRLASILDHQGKKEEAEAMTRRAQSHDPFSLSNARRLQF